MDGRGTCPEKGVAMGAKPGTKYKKFPKEHRDETADHVISTGRPVREVARELSMAGSALCLYSIRTERNSHRKLSTPRTEN